MEVELVECFGVNCYMICYVILVLVEDGFVCIRCGFGVFVKGVFMDYFIGK